jgi:hypothetical protein
VKIKNYEIAWKGITRADLRNAGNQGGAWVMIIERLNAKPTSQW